MTLIYTATSAFTEQFCLHQTQVRTALGERAFSFARSICYWSSSAASPLANDCSKVLCLFLPSVWHSHQFCGELYILLTHGLHSASVDPSVDTRRFTLLTLGC